MLCAYWDCVYTTIAFFVRIQILRVYTNIRLKHVDLGYGLFLRIRYYDVCSVSPIVFYPCKRQKHTSYNTQKAKNGK